MIKNVKDRHGKLMTDAYLKRKASADYTWINEVYKESSGFIHFSNKHIMDATSISKVEDDLHFSSKLGKTDTDVSYHSKLDDEDFELYP